MVPRVLQEWMCAIPKLFPKEFGVGVVRVARQCEAGVTMAQVARDFGIWQSCLTNGLGQG